ELDAVAESLFGGEKDPALAEGKSSQPEATAIATARVRHACAFPAPFIFRKPAHQLAEREERQRQVRMRVGIVPVDDYCFFKTRDRFAMPVERLQCTPAVVPGAMMLRGDCQCGIEARNCFAVTVEIEERRPAVVEGFGMARSARKQHIEIGKRFCMTAKPRECRAPIEKRL